MQNSQEILEKLVCIMHEHSPDMDISLFRDVLYKLIHLSNQELLDAIEIGMSEVSAALSEK